MPRVSGIDVMFLYGETPAWHMHVSGLVVMDPATAPDGFEAEAARSLIAERLASAPQFRWKLRDVAFGLDRPAFVEDDDFDLANHFHDATVPSPGGATELGELVGNLLERKLDHSHPLWEVWFIDGLADGCVATLTKIHHSIIDGMAGADLVGVIMDVEPLPQPRPPASVAAPEPAPSFAGGLAATVANAMRAPARTAAFAVQTIEQAGVFGRHMVRGTAAGLPMFAARSSVNGHLTPRRTLAYTSVAMDDARRVKDALGVKMNDVVLALVGGALRSWLAERGELPARSLVAEVPMSLRTDATRNHIGTQVANSFVTLATGVADPVERVHAIHRSSTDAKSLQRDLAAHKRVNLSDVPPPRLLGLAMRAFASGGLEARIPPIYSVIVSSVPGPPLELWVAGAKVRGVYPIGPLLYGSAVNVTALSLDDRIDFGIVSCPDVVADPWAIADRVQDELATLVAACSARTPVSR